MESLWRGEAAGVNGRLVVTDSGKESSGGDAGVAGGRRADAGGEQGGAGGW